MGPSILMKKLLMHVYITVHFQLPLQLFEGSQHLQLCLLKI